MMIYYQPFRNRDPFFHTQLKNTFLALKNYLILKLQKLLCPTTISLCYINMISLSSEMPPSDQLEHTRPDGQKDQ